MKSFWENKFGQEKTNWGFEPADSAIFTLLNNSVSKNLKNKPNLSGEILIN
jgi:hypothetical protein